MKLPSHKLEVPGVLVDSAVVFPSNASHVELAVSGWSLCARVRSMLWLLVRKFKAAVADEEQVVSYVIEPERGWDMHTCIRGLEGFVVNGDSSWDRSRGKLHSHPNLPRFPIYEYTAFNHWIHRDSSPRNTPTPLSAYIPCMCICKYILIFRLCRLWRKSVMPVASTGLSNRVRYCNRRSVDTKS